MDELFKLSNISRVEITKDGDQVLEFGPSDERAFKYFLETYSTELEDLFYQVDDHDDEDDDDDEDNEDEDIDVPGEEDSKDTDGSSIYEGDYSVDAFYNNGEVVRYIVSIDEVALSKIKELMNNLRNNPPKAFGEFEIEAIRDYSIGVRKDIKTGKEEKITLPKSNVLYYELANGEWCCARPSGTEPKVKFYMGVKGTSFDEAQAKLAALSDAVMKVVTGE